MIRRTIQLMSLVAAIVYGSISSSASGEVIREGTRPADDAKIALPVKVVVLYSSGVGYFQHAGLVSGPATAELRFKTDQISDIIKSLVLEDKNGTVSSVTYPSQDPLEKTLKSFQVDISGNPSLDQLLNQLRGASVTARMPAQANVTGVIVGVEKRTRPAGDNKTVEVPVLNVLADGSIRSIDLQDVAEIHLEDAALQQELMRALTALAAARDQDKKPVTIHFKGDGERLVQVGYVVEAPVWKTSYRLVLPDVHQPTTRPGDAPAALQGWAVVENQTDSDWANVQLSLVSGRPISFRENLYQPLYIPRPVVVPELFASLTAPKYDAAMSNELASNRPTTRPEAPFSANDSVLIPTDEDDGGGGGGRTAINPTHSIVAVASAAKLGELFEYTIGNVTIPRQSGAMIPIVTDPIDCQRVSIYNQSILAHNPLIGARLKNTTGKHLLTGPITVLDGSKYAGDAQIDNLPPNQDRLISYGVDLEMLVKSAVDPSSDEVLTGKIVRGTLIVSHKFIRTTQYDAENKSDHEKVLLIEHPIMAGWTLVDTPKPAESTDALYRFENTIASGKSLHFVVKQQDLADQGYRVLNFDDNGIIALSHGGALPAGVKDALIKAADLRRAIADTSRQLNENQSRENMIIADQNRINQTLRTVSDKTALYTRLLDKLNDQETQLETLRAAREKLTTALATQQKAFEDYLAGLNIE